MTLSLALNHRSYLDGAQSIEPAPVYVEPPIPYSFGMMIIFHKPISNNQTPILNVRLKSTFLSKLSKNEKQINQTKKNDISTKTNFT